MLMRRSFAKIAVDETPIIWLGANFWSRSGGPRMWSRYDAEVIEKELEVLRVHGLNVTRSFFYWPDFMPTPYSFDATALSRYADFLDAHERHGMKTIPTLIVGHMSGENWDPSWRQGRDLYGDVWLVARQAWFGAEMARRFAAHPAVAAWLVSNEMPIYGGNGDAEVITSWAELVVAGLRSGGATQPISLGDGAWGIETSGRDNGYRLRDLAKVVDFVGPHVYPMETDTLREHLKAAFVCELSAVTNQPVVLEEFGASTDFVSDENVAHYYRQVLHNSLLGGASGWIAWNNTDFDDLVAEPPYSHHPFEMHFGITDRDGSPKTPLRELRDFGEILDRVDIGRCRRTPAQTALVVPSPFDTRYPFTYEGDGPFMFEVLRQGYIAAREADLPVAMTWETDGIEDGARLYLVPSVKHLTGPGWRRLEQLAEAGATVYVSYCAGNHAGQRGPWFTGINELFGVRHGLRYGLVDRIESDQVTLTVEHPFGGLAAGDCLTVRAGGNENVRVYLPVTATDAQLLATDAQGRPALLRRNLGAGAMVLCTYPLEAMASAVPDVNPEDTWRLYRALAEEARVTRPVVVDDPRVLVDAVEHEDGRTFVWLVNASGESLIARPRRHDGGGLADLDGMTAVDEAALAPFGVHVLRYLDDPA
jgi:endo-1,4-beta-mannosidase